MTPDDPILWIIIGVGVPLIGGLFTLWWRVESGQNKRIKDCANEHNGKLESMREENSDDHKRLHDKIDSVRDKVEEIWKHLVKHKPD